MVHPCPRPRAVPPRVATTTTSRRSFLSIPARPSPGPASERARARAPSPTSSPSFHPSLSLARLRPLARSHAPARTCTLGTTHVHTFVQTHSLSLSLKLSLSYYPPTGSLFLRVTTQWRCHTLAPSSNQCYCFIVPLLLLLLDTRKGDPSIPESVRERRGRVASLRLALPCLAVPRRASSRASPKREPKLNRAERSGTRLFTGRPEPVFARHAFRDKRGRWPETPDAF